MSASHVSEELSRSNSFCCSNLQIGNEDQKERMDYIEQLNVMLKAENFASSVTLLPISPWGHFTTSLNGAVQNAVDNGFDIIAFQVGFLNSFL
jgi:hypothetical protein